MLVIVEGVDGSGKSTLVRKLTEYLDNEGIQFNADASALLETHPKRQRLEATEIIKNMRLMANDPSRIYIADRSFLSDGIYRIFDDYKPTFDIFDASYELDNFVNEHGLQSDLVGNLTIIYCRTQVAEEAMRLRGDDNPVALQRHKELTKLYDVCSKSWCAILCARNETDLRKICRKGFYAYDFMLDPVSDLFKTIVGDFKARRRMTLC